MKNNHRKDSMKDIANAKYVNLQVGDNDLIGNKFNGHDLHINLRKMGIESSHLVWNKESDDDNTYVIAGEKQDRFAISVYNQYVQRLYDLDNVHNPLMYDIIYNQLFLDADVVHLHLMHNGLWDLNLLPMMSKLKPIIWTVHDMWIATGDPHAKERPDYFFPYLTGAKNFDFNWELKKEAIKNSNITFVVASKYMEQAMKEYPLFNDKKIVYVPFGLDFKLFYPRNNAVTRKELNLDVLEKLILLRGDGGIRKGLNYIDHVIKTLGKKYKLHFLIVGQNELDIPDGVKATFYGWIKDDELMAKLYSVADLFLMPSTREYFGMMAMESMACGTLPIVLDGTSLPDTVNAPSCGVSTGQDMKEYSDAVEYYLNHPAERAAREKKCLNYVKKEHGMEKYLKSLDALYRSEANDFKISSNFSQILSGLKAINEIKPLQKAIVVDVSHMDITKYQEKNLFFETTMWPLKHEITRLSTENDVLMDRNNILLDENSILRQDILDIYNSRRWKIISRVANYKSYGDKFVNLIKHDGLYKASKKIAKKVHNKSTK